MSDKVDFKENKITMDTEGYYIIIKEQPKKIKNKRATQKDDILSLTVYALNKRATKYMKLNK